MLVYQRVVRLFGDKKNGFLGGGYILDIHSYRLYRGLYYPLDVFIIIYIIGDDIF